MKCTIFFNSFFIACFFVLFFGIGDLFSVADQELFNALDQLVYIIQDANQFKDKAEDVLKKNINVLLQKAVSLTYHKGDEALALIGSDLNLRYGSYKYGLITYLFLYCAQQYKKLGKQLYLERAEALSKAVALELALKSNPKSIIELWKHPFERELDTQAWTSEKTEEEKNKLEEVGIEFFTASKSELDRLVTRLNGDKLKIKNLNKAFEKLSNRNSVTIDEFIANNLLRQDDDSLSLKWVRDRIRRHASEEAIQMQIRHQPSVTERASIDREKNERTLLKMILGVGALAGAVFVISYAMGYKPSFQVQQRLQQMQGWNKIQVLARSLLANWKKIGAVALMTRLRFINNYYNKVIGPRIQSGIVGLTRRRAPVVTEQGPRLG